jgi:hypothetical protein
MRTIIRLLPLLFATALLNSCIAYSVGTTARPVPQGEFQPNLSAYWVPNGIEPVSDDSVDDTSLAYSSADFEGRWGLSPQSDLALRVPSGSGAIVTYKRLINGPNDPNRMAVATIVGGGIVNFGNHAYVEGGLIASGRESSHVPYGGVRIMHVVPLNSSAVSDTPTIGAFGGIKLRIGTNFAISPELGVYHDKSALGLRKSDVIVIPSITFHWD